MMKQQTEAQGNRQKFRDSNGKYSNMTEYCCEDCGKFVGLNYWSDPHCNDTGDGMVLCKNCCQKRVEREENAQ